jgi:hypothetical protein
LGYLAETDTPSGEIPLDYLNNQLPAFVAEAAITHVANSLCFSSNRRRLALDCVLSVSSGEAGQHMQTCVPGEGSQSCDIYSDQFVVLHTEECTSDEIRAQSTLLVKDGLESGTFLEHVNANTDGPTVTLLEYYDLSAFAGSVSEYSNQTISPAGKAAVAVVALLVVCLLIFAFVWARRRRYDDKSVHTKWSNSTDDNSYMRPDFHDLAFRHSKMDVHKCKSALCKTCRPTLGQVDMVPVPRNQPGAKAVYDSILPEHDETNGGQRATSPVNDDLENLDIRPASGSTGEFHFPADAVEQDEDDGGVTFVRKSRGKRALSKASSSKQDESSFNEVVL